LSRLSASFIWLTLNFPQGRQSRPSVLMHSSNHYPLGNCDSPKSETNLGYLTQFGAVSNRSSLPSSFFAITGGARTPPEELVNLASSAEYISSLLHRGRVNQPDPTFPRSPGRILETVSSRLSAGAAAASAAAGAAAFSSLAASSAAYKGIAKPKLNTAAIVTNFFMLQDPLRLCLKR
jgi:hypothetical protein